MADLLKVVGEIVEASLGLRDHMERELAASVRQLRAVQAGQQVAAQHAADEQRKLQGTLREEREKAAQLAAHTQVQRPDTSTVQHCPR